MRSTILLVIGVAAGQSVYAVQTLHELDNARATVLVPVFFSQESSLSRLILPRLIAFGT